MRNEIKTETEILDGIVKETYDYIEIEDKKVKHGLCKYYDYKGNLEEECFYKMGKKHGKSNEYYHGEWKAEGNYSQGKKDEIWLVKTYDGKVKKVLYINGIEQELETREEKESIYKQREIVENKIPKIFILLVIMSILTIFTLILWEENKSLERKLEKENVAEEIMSDFPKAYSETIEK